MTCARRQSRLRSTPGRPLGGRNRSPTPSRRARGILPSSSSASARAIRMCMPASPSSIPSRRSPYVLRSTTRVTTACSRASSTTCARAPWRRPRRGRPARRPPRGLARRDCARAAPSSTRPRLSRPAASVGWARFARRSRPRGPPRGLLSGRARRRPTSPSRTLAVLPSSSCRAASRLPASAPTRCRRLPTSPPMCPTASGWSTASAFRGLPRNAIRVPAARITDFS